MNDERIKIGEKYLHYKGNVYTLLDYPVYIKDTIKEYKAVYIRCETGINKDKRYVRELNDFLSKVNHNKYPLVIQRYKFELIQNN